MNFLNLFKSKNTAVIDSIIDSKALIKGDVLFEGGMNILGKVKGNVASPSESNSTLVISETAQIEGRVDAHIVIIHGTVNGPIYSSGQVTVGSTAKVKGNIYYNKIHVDQGQIEGQLIPFNAVSDEQRTVLSQTQNAPIPLKVQPNN